MKFKKIIGWIGALFICGVFLLPSLTAGAATSKPNILFILTDDQRWDTIHALGNSEIKTPNLDRLVQKGFHFNNAYCMGSMHGAVCLPSRTMLITGRSLWKIPANPRATNAPPAVPLLPTLMKEAGYATFHCGKAGNSCTFGNSAFDINISTQGRTTNSATEHADETIKFLKNHDGGKPFFIYLAPPVPHDPRLAPAEFTQLYDPSKISLSKNFMPQHPFDNGELHVRDEDLAPHPRTPEVMRQHLADYYSTISHLDHEVGRVLDTLKQRGFAGNTIIIFSSDQGLAVGGRHGLMGKQNLYEHVKPPLIFVGPGIRHGQSDALVYLYDLFPTICDFGGANNPDIVEGKSLSPIIEGKKNKVREYLFGAYRDCQRMIRDERWKLIKYNASGVKNLQLFDLKNDPDELNNLASSAKYSNERTRLEKLLLEAREQFGDPVDFEKPSSLPGASGVIEELSPIPPGKKFLGAPEPKKILRGTPLTPDEERNAFVLPPGFEIELVASESEGIGKFVTVDWDTRGRMWSMTALEYPVDANENPAVAQELYASRAKDKVLVFDRDASSPTGYSSKPRVFAEGLAIPLGILPYKNGVYVQHGTEIVFLSDTDGDGLADKREIILSGFGVQDSHLFPHQFTRAPGNWLWMAQGAFNYSKVRTTRGVEKQFDQTRMAKFRADGSDFEITSQGPCNIWGLAFTAEGECWIQEANDFGYPAMPFHEYANYPGCSGGQWKSYAPEFPGTAPDFQMGGTGLSGLALSDARGAWPEPYADVMYVANPITRKIQALKILRDGPRYELQKLPDFIQSSDEMFRPVSIHFGPDGCLYIVDWYNKIISHNEVPRNHPDRDKKRGRIWRVKHREQKPFDVPDFTKGSGDKLLAKLGDESQAQHHLAWQAITDRQLTNLAPDLRKILGDKSQSAARRIGALWALEGLQQLDATLLKPLFTDTNRNVRREAMRACGEAGLPPGELFYQSPLTHDPEPEVRAEVIRVTGRYLANGGAKNTIEMQGAIRILVNVMDLAPLDGPLGKSTFNGKLIKVREAYERDYERYLARLFLEQQPKLVEEFLQFDSQGRPLENSILATLALEPKVSATRLAEWLPKLYRVPEPEEVLRLAQFPEQPGVADALKAIFKNSGTREATLEALLKVRRDFDATKLAPLLADTAKILWADDASARLLSIRLTSSFKLSAMEELIDDALLAGNSQLSDDAIILALRAMRELGGNQIEGILTHLQSPRMEVADEAVAALASSRNQVAAQILFNKFWSDLSAAQRRSALSLLSGAKQGASGIMQAVASGALPKSDLDVTTLEKLHAVLGDDSQLAALLRERALTIRPVLRLDGGKESYADANLTLAGAFTVETWLKLDPNISNEDGILGVPGGVDFNFAGGLFRIYCGPQIGDRLISKKIIVPDVWNHFAVTRDGSGVFHLYLNGELDATDTRAVTNTFAGLGIGRTTPPARDTAGWLTEFRVWNRPRTAEEIRADFDCSFEGEVTPSGLQYYFTGTNWPPLKGSARVAGTADFPPLLNPAEAKAMAEKLSKFRALAGQSGNANQGQKLFATLCMSCHAVAGKGGQVGPVLNGAGANGIEALLRNVLTPNAAMESGYRIFRVELNDGDLLDGFLVSQDKEAIVLRRPNVEDTRLEMKEVRRAEFTKRSLMPEGLLEGMQPRDVTDLLTYLQTLK